MENRKVYARQIPPEYQESPLFALDWDEETHPGLVVTGNQDFHSHTVPVWDTWRTTWEDAADELDKLQEEPARAWYHTVTEMIQDLFPPLHKPRYNTREIHRRKEILADMRDCPPASEWRPTLAALGLMTGHEWDYTTIRGSCQGEWQDVYFDTTQWSQEAINELEIEYFNEGEEWIVYSGEADPESPEDIERFSVYTHGWRDDDARREIAEAAGVSPEDVILYRFSGWTRSACYRVQREAGRND